MTGMLEMVSSELNNTPAVCRRSYIHPEVIERYLDGNLVRDWTKASARGSRLLSPEERRLLHLLESFTRSHELSGTRGRAWLRAAARRGR